MEMVDDLVRQCGDQGGADLDDHPSPAELEGFVWDRVSTERAQEVTSHLMSGCAECCAVVAPHLKAVLGIGDPPPRVLTPQEEAGYEAAIDRAFSITLKKAGELRQARKRKALLLLESGDPVPEVPPDLWGLPFFEALLERSWFLRHENPSEMLRLASWAQMLAERMEPYELDFGPRELTDLRCRAFLELGNAYRVADNLVEAESALGLATRLFLDGTQSEVLAGRLFTVLASFFTALRQFDLSETALDIALGFYKSIRDQHMAGRTLIMKGVLLGYGEKPEEAIRNLEEGLELIDEQREPELVFAAAQNHIRLLVACGRFREARVALFHLKVRRLDTGGRLTELKLRWLEAQINVELGKLDDAEQGLLKVKEAFEEMELGYKAALAGLELGAVMLRRGCPADATREVLQAADVFQAVGVRREAAASLLLLRKTFERQKADAALLNHVITLLRRGEDQAGGEE